MAELDKTVWLSVIHHRTKKKEDEEPYNENITTILQKNQKKVGRKTRNSRVGNSWIAHSWKH